MAGTINIDNFVTNFTDPGARGNKFRVIIPLAGQNLEFMAHSTSGIPKSELSSLKAHYQGRVAQYGGSREFSEWSVDVYNDETWDIRRTLELWSKNIQGHDIIDSPFMENGTYKSTTGVVQQLSVSGAVLREYTFVNLWPKVIGEIKLDWDEQQLETFNVSFRYDYWTVTGGTTGISTS